MRSILIIIGVIIIISLTGYTAEISRTEFSVYLREGQKAISPDGRYTCWIERITADTSSSFDTVNLLIQCSSETPQKLWTTFRTLGVEWSPDSHWLAVNDHYLASESAILIFDMRQKFFPLIYQTPLSSNTQDSWRLIGWNIKKKQIQIKKIKRFYDDVEIKTITLLEKPIKEKLPTP